MMIINKYIKIRFEIDYIENCFNKSEFETF